jgi:hypothetical protein
MGCNAITLGIQAGALVGVYRGKLDYCAQRTQPLCAMLQEANLFPLYNLGCASGGDAQRPVVDKPGRFSV